MIAVNIMEIDTEAIDTGDSLARVLEKFSSCEADVLPVLKNDGVIVGVLSKKMVLKAMNNKTCTMDAAEICKKSFKSAGPEATFQELRGLLDGPCGAGRTVFIVDKGGRLLGSVDESELTLRAGEYGEPL